MAQKVRDVMTADPATVDGSAPATEAAALMRDRDTGAIVVTEGDRVSGLVTDRDIVVRAVADGRNPVDVKAGDLCSADLVTVSPDDEVERVIEIMRERAVRRVPVVEDGAAVGIVSIGDLAIERDRESALADISAAPANR
jgi:CBS domain-containing protein